MVKKAQGQVTEVVKKRRPKISVGTTPAPETPPADNLDNPVNPVPGNAPPSATSEDQPQPELNPTPTRVPTKEFKASAAPASSRKRVPAKTAPTPGRQESPPPIIDQTAVEESQSKFLKALLQTAMVSKLVIKGDKRGKDRYYDRLVGYKDISKPSQTSGSRRCEQAKLILRHVYLAYCNYQIQPGVDKSEQFRNILKIQVDTIHAETTILKRTGLNSHFAWGLRRIAINLGLGEEKISKEEVPTTIQNSPEYMSPILNFIGLFPNTTGTGTTAMATREYNYHLESEIQEIILFEIYDILQNNRAGVSTDNPTYNNLLEWITKLLFPVDPDTAQALTPPEKVALRDRCAGLIDADGALTHNGTSLVSYIRRHLDAVRNSVPEDNQPLNALFDEFQQWSDLIDPSAKKPTSSESSTSYMSVCSTR